MTTLRTGSRTNLELGCGKRKFDASFVGVDCLPLTDADGNQVPDIVWDLDRGDWIPQIIEPAFVAALAPGQGGTVTIRGGGIGWPWAEDNSCSFVIAHQTLEHLYNLIPAMNEVWRICDDDAWFEVIVPYYKSPAAFQDPTHVRFFTEMTFRYWEPGMVEDFSDYGIKGYFGLGAQRWREDGNLWALLRPIKTGGDLGLFRAWQGISENGRNEYPMTHICPAELLARCDQHNFLGGPE